MLIYQKFFYIIYEIFSVTEHKTNIKFLEVSIVVTTCNNRTVLKKIFI